MQREHQYCQLREDGIPIIQSVFHQTLFRCMEQVANKYGVRVEIVAQPGEMYDATSELKYRLKQDEIALRIYPDSDDCHDLSPFFKESEKILKSLD